MPDSLSHAARQEAIRLTRAARQADDAERAAALRERREELLAEAGYAARVREEGHRDVLVCYPGEWVVDGTVQPDAIESIEDAIEIPLSGPGDPDDWDELAAHNRAIAERVASRHGPDHGANAAAFAEYMNNHLAKPIEAAAPAEIGEFLDEYYRRNVWPSDAQRALVEESVELVRELAEKRAL